MLATTVEPVHTRRGPGHPRWDALALGLSIGHGAVLLLAPSAVVVALGMWWNANTIAHQVIHRPLFRRRAMNRLYSAYLTLLLGVPQSLWRQRHLDHHFPERHRATDRRGGIAHDVGRVRDRRGIAPAIWLESALLFVIWTIVVAIDWRFFTFTYLPGWMFGLLLCQLHGYYEHARGTTSHYGRLYNFLFFNDGLHVEHHASPSTHWSELQRPAPATGPDGSRWPPVLRWLDAFSLNGLERLVLHSRTLQGLMVRTHARAFASLLPHAGAVARVTIVGGGLFPRTPLVVRALWPGARLTVLERDARHLESARRLIADVDWRLETFVPATRLETDMLIVPLAYVGDRDRLYSHPPAGRLIVHDWLWRPRGRSVVVAWWLFKRLNLVDGEAAGARPERPAA